MITNRKRFSTGEFNTISYYVKLRKEKQGIIHK